MKFELNMEEEKALKKWEETHTCNLRGKSCCGGETTVSFTATSLGMAVTASCICGAEIELREVCG